MTPDPKLERKLPDPAVCRAEDSGFGKSVDCLVKPPFSCPHAIRIVYGIICQHPEKAAIVVQTMAETAG